MKLLEQDERPLNAAESPADYCEVVDCYKARAVRGMCRTHYREWLRRKAGAKIGNRTYTAEQVQAVRDYIGSGKSYGQAEAHFGISKSQCHRMVRREQRREVA